KKDKEERKSEVKSSESSDSAAVEISEDELKAASSEKTEGAVTNNGGISASTDDETLLAALIQCECNGPYEAQLAVGAVVVNRANGGYGSISNAIYAPYQFGPASSGKLARTLSSGAISATARQAAHDAINGVSNVGNAKYFRNVSSGHAGIVIGNHVYW
nr:cell wall hydrolase [Lachnospiraceae bacterium]